MVKSELTQAADQAAIPPDFALHHSSFTLLLLAWKSGPAYSERTEQ
jgi:hypothetical protein